MRESIRGYPTSDESRVARLAILSPKSAKLAKSGPPLAKFIFDLQVYLVKFQTLPANSGKYFLAIFDPV